MPSTKLEICVSRKVCDLCHQFAILEHLRNGVEVSFFVVEVPDYPLCQTCSTPIIGYWALDCRDCQAMSITTIQAQLGYRNLTADDICKVQQGLQWYIKEIPPNNIIKQQSVNDLRRIEADPAFALKYYNARRTWLNLRLQKCHHIEIFEHLSSIEWKFNRQGPDSDTDELHSGQAADIKPTPDAVEDGDHDHENDGEEDNSVATLSRQIAVMDCKSS